MSPTGLGTARRAVTALLLCVGAATVWGRPMPASSACPSPETIEPLHLYGLWEVRFWPEGGDENRPASHGTLHFERHPQYPGSVRGELLRTLPGHQLSAQVSGDVTDGVFNLDESADGVTMSALWVGQVHDCGRSLRGTRRVAENQPTTEPPQHFHLFKRPGWR